MSTAELSPKSWEPYRFKRRIGGLAVVLAMIITLLTAPTPAADAQSGELEPGSATVVPLQVTGPPEERLNLIILGDGYTADEMQKFRDQVDKHLNIQWSIEPFRSYRSYFNVYMIEVVSAESGISCDPDDGNVRRDTALNLQYASNCPADPLARGITFGSGGQAALNEYVSMIPGVTTQNRQTLTLANTDTYGGIGGTNATTSGGSPQGPLISPHELGHSLGGLQDEYPYSARGVAGPAYTGNEPRSIHHTILTVEEMLDQQVKWWRWLGEESESGGIIGAYESGQYRETGIWRPSEHSMMRWLGFHFDQVSRERMTERISGRRGTEAMSVVATPDDVPVGQDQVVWVETAHPKYHELDVSWTLNGETLPHSDGVRDLDLGAYDVAAGDVLEVTVVDPTEFVRDPAIRDSANFTITRSWTIGDHDVTPTPVEVAFTLSTPNDRPVGGEEIVYVETTHPVDRVLDVAWSVDGVPVSGTANSRSLDLARRHLAPGTHTLTAVLTDPAGGDTDERTWTVDATAPEVAYEVSEPLATLGAGDSDHYVYLEQFTMGLEPTDDQAGYVVAEFRLDEDGWFNYFGWPDAPEGTPYLFTPAGTNIKELIYGNLGTGGMSKAPFEQEYPDFEPGYGTHLIEHRAIDAAGNIGGFGDFTATVLPGTPLECTTTVTGRVMRGLAVTTGVTCVDGAEINGPVNVSNGAALVVTGGRLADTLVADGAGVVQLVGTTVAGRTIVSGVDEFVAADTTFQRSISIEASGGEFPIAVVGNTLRGSIACEDNTAGVSDFGAPNRITGTASGECADL